MTAFRASHADVFSNARVKLYPSVDVLQVANAPIFRAPGWEPQKRAYDVPPKGRGKDPDRALEVSRARAKAAVRDIARCNRFDFFFTWTLDPKLIDRYDADAVKRAAYTHLKNLSSRKGFRYVIVPEHHRDGAIHFHGLCILGDVRIAPATDAHTGRPLFTDRQQPIFNMLDWKLGYSTCIPIDENYDRTCNYLVKYFTKDAQKMFGKWYLSSRSLRKKPDIELISDGMDYGAFRADYPELSEIPLYCDVCMTSLDFPKDGGDCP